MIQATSQAGVIERFVSFGIATKLLVTLGAWIGMAAVVRPSGCFAALWCSIQLSQTLHGLCH